MPFINVKTSVKLSENNAEEIKAELGKAISLFPGKSENWLMCEIESDRKMYFKGSSDDCAFIEVKLFGNVDNTASEKFTAEICNCFEKYGVSSGRVYVRYEGGTSWGWNGSNF